MLVKITNSIDTTLDVVYRLAEDLAHLPCTATREGWEIEVDDDDEAQDVIERLEDVGFTVDYDEEPAGTPRMSEGTPRMPKASQTNGFGSMKMPKITFGSKGPEIRGRKNKYGDDDVARDKNPDSGYPNLEADGLPVRERDPGYDWDAF